MPYSQQGQPEEFCEMLAQKDQRKSRKTYLVAGTGSYELHLQKDIKINNFGS